MFQKFKAPNNSFIDHLNFDVSKELKAWIIKRANKIGMSQSQLCREILEKEMFHVEHMSNT
jgi:hypothetical protein